MQQKSKKIKAFSLIELSIVIVIVSIIASSSLFYFTSKIDKIKVEKTQKRIQTLYNAIGAYLLKNKELPCPAPLNEVPNQSNFGKAGDCTAVSGGVFIAAASTDLIYGMVPVKTLGLPSHMASDFWGSKIAYVVDKEHAESGDFGKTAIDEDILFRECINAGCLSYRPLDNSGTMALISYGANKAGAFNLESTSRNDRSSLDSERRNDIDLASPYFTGDFAYAGYESEFDDILLFKTSDAIMVDFNLFHLGYCDDPGFGYFNNWADHYKYNAIAYGTFNCPHRNAIRAAKKCGVSNQWVTINSCP